MSLGGSTIGASAEPAGGDGSLSSVLVSAPLGSAVISARTGAACVQTTRHPPAATSGGNQSGSAEQSPAAWWLTSHVRDHSLVLDRFVIFVAAKLGADQAGDRDGALGTLSGAAPLHPSAVVAPITAPRSSIGTGKMIVLFLSAAISVKICK
jgi:hypothetical protein